MVAAAAESIDEKPNCRYCSGIIWSASAFQAALGRYFEIPIGGNQR